MPRVEYGEITTSTGKVEPMIWHVNHIDGFYYLSSFGFANLLVNKFCEKDYLAKISTGEIKEIS